MTAERAYSTRVAYHVARRLKLRADPVEETFFPRRVPRELFESRAQPARVNRVARREILSPASASSDAIPSAVRVLRSVSYSSALQCKFRSRNARASNLQTLLF